MEALNLFMKYAAQAALAQETKSGKEFDKEKAQAYVVKTGAEAFNNAVKTVKQDTEDASFGFKTKKLTAFQKQAATVSFKHAAVMYGVQIYENSL
jgi:4-aminobutyrate aminotransferase-like enzyme